mgnify:FL=1
MSTGIDPYDPVTDRDEGVELPDWLVRAILWLAAKIM